MSSENTTTAKSNKAKFGLMGAPIGNVVKVLKKDQAHDFGGKAGVSWVIITGDNKIIKATTYDGNLGARFNLGEHNTQPLPAEGSKDLRKALKGYSEVATSECPVVEVPAA